LLSTGVERREFVVLLRGKAGGARIEGHL
jgi:hypothetical protein